MRTRKKVVASNGSQEQSTPRLCKQRNVTVIAERKVKELITSAKKQKSGGVCLNKIKDVEESKGLDTIFALSQENGGFSVAYGSSFDDERSDKGPAECEKDTIFSPAYHHPKDVSGGITDRGDFLKCSKNNDQSDQFKHVDEEGTTSIMNNQASLNNSQLDSIDMNMGVAFVRTFDRNTSSCRISETFDIQANAGQDIHIDPNDAINYCDDKYSALGTLSSEVSAIYLAMQHSKLECADEMSQDTTEGCADVDESDDDYDDFDPYTFIKDLPDLSLVVPKFRPVLLPKQTRSCPSTTLVLDLDETLVHSSLEPCQDADFTFPVNFNLKEHTIYVRCRPYLKDFLERVAGLFEIIIFTASQGIYAARLLNILDPKRKLFRHRIYRESCVYVDGNYLKDLSVLGRDLARVIIIDNSPQAFGFQLENGIPIESWFDDQNDQELVSLLPFLESLVGVDDVRPVIAQKFNLREKVDASPCTWVHF